MTGQCTGTSFECERARERVGLTRGPRHGDVKSECINGVVALGNAAENAVPFVRIWRADVAEDMDGVMEISGGRDGAEI